MLATLALWLVGGTLSEIEAERGPVAFGQESLPLASTQTDFAIFQLEEAAFQQAAASAAKSVVMLEWVGGRTLLGERLPGGARATGTIVTADGLIVTSTYFFLDRPQALLIRYRDGQTLPGRLLGRDFNRMVTVVQGERKGEDFLPQWCPDSEVAVGMWTIALGWTVSDEPHAAVGILSARRRIWGKAFQTDAATSPHNYGGPLVDIMGRIVGIVVPFSPDGRDPVAGVQWYDSGIGFAVPVADVLAVLSRLAAGEDLFPGRAGIRFGHPNPILAEPVVAEVEPASPAEKAGLKPGDRLIRVGGRPVRRAADVEEIIQQHYGGDQLAIEINRGDRALRVELTLALEIWPGLRSSQ